ncbi:MAG: succinylglutamate desuccinylase/aspartoacylase family protein [Pseudomonadota bacterium]
MFEFEGIDLERPGLQVGAVKISAGEDSTHIPIVTIGMGDGPVLFINAGTHGDEYEGPIALRNVLRDLDPKTISGRLIAIPNLNPPAARAITRRSPVDDVDLNRAFPGKPDGSLSQRIASFVSEAVIPRCDAVVDLHAAGRDYQFEPHVMLHVPEQLKSRAIFDETLAAARAFGLSRVLVVEEPEDDDILNSEGMLDTLVESLGKVFLCVEAGGAGTTLPQTVAATERGIRNMLAHFDLIPDPAIAPQSPTTPSHIPPNGYQFAGTSGLLEVTCGLGECLAAGQRFARIHSLDGGSGGPHDCLATINGQFVARRHPAFVEEGSLIGGIAKPFAID